MNTNTSSKTKTIPTYGKQDIEQCMSNFRLLVLNNSDDIQKVKENLINSGKMSHSEKEYIRAFSWRIFLGTILIDEKSSLKSLIEKTLNKRKTIKNLIKKNTVGKLKGDPLGGLSVGNDGDKDAEGWDSFFNQSETANLINFDVDRTMPSEKLFQEPYIREMQSTILKLFAKNHKTVSYKQGMNEILSLIIYAIYPYYVKSPINKYTNEIIDKWVKDPIGNYKEIYHFFHDENELQNDVYYLMENLMIKFGLYKFYDDEQKEGKTPYFIKRANTIIKRKLGQADKQMYLHLINQNLDYCMVFQRWLKCLFKREFPPRESCLIWDTIFAHEAEKQTGELFYVDYIVIAMLIHLKNELIKRDENEMFEILLKYPKVTQFRDLLNLAEKIKRDLTVTGNMPQNKQNDDKSFNQITSSSSKEQPIVKREQIKVEEGSQSTKNMIQINPLLFNPNLMMNPQLQNNFQNNQNMMFYPYNPMMVQQPINQPKSDPKTDFSDYVLISKEDLSPIEKIKSSYYVSDSSSVNALKELKALGNKYKNIMSIEDKNRLDHLIDTLSKQL